MALPSSLRSRGTRHVDNNNGDTTAPVRRNQIPQHLLQLRRRFRGFEPRRMPSNWHGALFAQPKYALESEALGVGIMHVISLKLPICSCPKFGMIVSLQFEKHFASWHRDGDVGALV